MTFWLSFLAGVVTTFLLSVAYTIVFVYRDLRAARVAVQAAEALQDFPRNMDMPASDWRQLVAAAEMVRDVELVVIE